MNKWKFQTFHSQITLMDSMLAYGILNNTNIGYIYVLSETGPGNSQFDQAVASLQNTDALIIDMRWNEGGITSWSGAFNILANESFPTLEFAYEMQSFRLYVMSKR